MNRENTSYLIVSLIMFLLLISALFLGFKIRDNKLIKSFEEYHDVKIRDQMTFDELIKDKACSNFCSNYSYSYVDFNRSVCECYSFKTNKMILEDSIQVMTDEEFDQLKNESLDN